MAALALLLTIVALVGLVAGYLYLARRALTKVFGPEKTIGPLISPKGIRAERAARRAKVSRGRLDPVKAPKKPGAKVPRADSDEAKSPKSAKPGKAKSKAAKGKSARSGA